MALALQAPGNVTRRLPLVTGGLVALCIAVYMLPPLVAWSIYERASIVQGEWWRLLSAHLVHFNSKHLIFNMLGLALTASLIEVHSRRRLCELTGLMLLVIGPTLFLLHPDMAWYGGISGLVYGYAFYCALWLHATQPSLKWLSRVALLLISLKILADSLGLGFPLTADDGAALQTMSASHATGVLTALLFYLTRHHAAKASG